MRGIIMKLDIKVKLKTSAILIKNCLYSFLPYMIDAGGAKKHPLKLRGSIISLFREEKCHIFMRQDSVKSSKSAK